MSDFKVKCTKLFAGWVSPQTPLGGAYSTPQTPSWILGGLFLRGRGREGRGRESDRGEGQGEEERGKGERKEGRGRDSRPPS